MSKTQIMDMQAVNRAIARISHEIIERNQGVLDICILGVKKRGVMFAKKICAFSTSSATKDFFLQKYSQFIYTTAFLEIIISQNRYSFKVFT